MFRSPSSFSVGTAALCVLLAALFLVGCRGPEPADTKKTTARETARTASLPLRPAPAESVIIAPLTVFEDPDLPPVDAIIKVQEPSPKPKTPRASLVKKRPCIALIIDDMGDNQQVGQQLLRLELNLTFSFLPDAPYTAEQSETAFRLGRDVLVHLPMEPKNPAWDPGAAGLWVQDSPTDIRRKMAGMLAAVPHAIGANNHMGSRFTENVPGMRVVMNGLKDRSFFFIDSFTTAASQGVATARQMGVPVARRDVFLDNDREPRKICRQMDQLVALAKKQGWAIGIGHPNRATLTALTQCNRERFREVEIVGVHRMVQ